MVVMEREILLVSNLSPQHRLIQQRQERMGRRLLSRLLSCRPRMELKQVTEAQATAEPLEQATQVQGEPPLLTEVVGMEAMERVPQALMATAGLDLQGVMAASVLDLQEVTVLAGQDLQEVMAASVLDLQEITVLVELDLQEGMAATELDLQEVMAATELDLQEVTAATELDLQEVMAATELDLQEVMAATELVLQEVMAATELDLQGVMVPMGLDIQEGMAATELASVGTARQRHSQVTALQALSGRASAPLAMANQWEALQPVRPCGKGVRQWEVTSSLDMAQVATEVTILSMVMATMGTTGERKEPRCAADFFR